ncbi:hypothetical protein Dsin_000449 [Dipteronia sinensis]|uniref:SWIM-type domain-containing protein n=1 Tax=Dipteronia sinensis TaxID=43782 RepID=A0AAE0B223_9ROSI|nr:hypothetical protein Dsin_000449 [Dipteronia sinensis]
MTDLNDVDFSSFEGNTFDSDGDNEHVGADGVPEAVSEIPDEIGNNDLFEGYQSKSDDEFFSDSDDEGCDSKLATVMKSNPFKKLIGCPIRFEGFNFKKIKNDNNRLTWACLAENYPWRLHTSIVGDETTMQVKIYNNDHTCHRIYKSQEVRAKWIASKFEVLVKDDPSIQCGVISDLVKDQFNVSVDPQRLYKAKKRALKEMLCFLNYPEDRLICFMSDMFCARHIYANFIIKYSGQMMRKLFWKASKTGDKHEFKKCLQDIGSINPQARAYLAAIELCHYSMHTFDNSIKCDHMTNNMTEAFNIMFKYFRSRTYLGLMEYIRRMVMNRFQLRKEECSRWGNGIPLAVNKKIKDNSVECRILRTLHSGEGKYEMLGLNRAYTANLNDKTCEGGQWQVNRVPCYHAFGCYMIHHILDLCVWGDHEGAPIEPPPLKRKPRRPKLLRKRESAEKPKAVRSGSVVCGKCRQPGHNSRICKTEGSPVETKRASAKQVDVSDKSSQPTTQVQSQPTSPVTQLE